MLKKTVAMGYIQALFETAKAQNRFQETEKDLEKVAQFLKENQDLKKILLHPAIPKGKKIQIIDSLLSPQVNPLVRNFLRLVVDKRRGEVLELLEDVYKPVADHVGGIIRATVQTVIPLTGERIVRLKDTLERHSKKKVELTTELKPELLGGVVVRIGNKVIDGSISSRLENLRRRLVERRAAGF